MHSIHGYAYEEVQVSLPTTYEQIPVTTLASGQGGPLFLTKDATRLYWNNFDGGTDVVIDVVGYYVGK